MLRSLGKHLQTHPGAPRSEKQNKKVCEMTGQRHNFVLFFSCLLYCLFIFYHYPTQNHRGRSSSSLRSETWTSAQSIERPRIEKNNRWHSDTYGQFQNSAFNLNAVQHYSLIWSNYEFNNWKIYFNYYQHLVTGQKWTPGHEFDIPGWECSIKQTPNLHLYRLRVWESNPHT